MNASPTAETAKFTPVEQWDVADPIDQSTKEVIAEMNAVEPQKMIADLKKEVKEDPNGTKYAVLRGDDPEAYSKTDALVMFNPFGNTATSNMLVRAEFIRRVAQKEEIADQEGKLKPVIMLASPGVDGSNIRLTQDERQALRHGELGLAAEKMLKAVEAEEFGYVALLGFSQGADIAVAGARHTYSANLDLDSIAAGDPAGVEARSRIKLAADFMKALDLKPSLKRTGLDVQKVALGGVVDLMDFGRSTLYRTNQDLYKGMSIDSFESRANEIIEEDRFRKFIVGYGENSQISKPGATEPMLDRLEMNAGHNDFISIKVKGANHTWGDQLPLLAKLYMRAAS